MYSDTHILYVFIMHAVYMSLFLHLYDTCHILHDISNQDAEMAWNMALENPDLYKIGEGPNKRVAVHGIPTIEGVRSKGFQREVAHASELGNPGLMETALARLDFATQGVDMSRDFGVMGDAFRPGSAIGQSSVMAHDAGNMGGGAPMVTPDQISAMPLRLAASSVSTPAAPPPADRSNLLNMSPRAARIDGLC